MALPGKSAATYRHRKSPILPVSLLPPSIPKSHIDKNKYKQFMLCQVAFTLLKHLKVIIKAPIRVSQSRKGEM